MIRLRHLIMAGVWVLFPLEAVYAGMSMMPRVKPTLPIGGLGSDWPWILLATFFFFLAGPFAIRNNAYRWGPSAQLAKLAFGEAYFDLVISLKPTLLAIVTFAAVGISGLVSTYVSTQSFAGYLGSGFFLAGAMGVLVAYLLSIKYPPTLP
jgi:hypothetical protein